MSKTDKTNPYFVRFFYEPSYLQPVHRHELHDCDLPPKPRPQDVDEILWHGKPEESCFWWPSLEFWRSRWAKCPCPMCHGFYYDQSNPKHPRQQRRNARRYAKELWRDEY